MGEASDDLASLYLLRRRTGLCVLYERRKVLSFANTSGNVLTSRITGSACRIDTVYVAVLWRDYTVGGPEYRTVKAFKFLLLFLKPCQPSKKEVTPMAERSKTFLAVWFV